MSEPMNQTIIQFILLNELNIRPSFQNKTMNQSTNNPYEQMNETNNPLQYPSKQPNKWMCQTNTWITE